MNTESTVQNDSENKSPIRFAHRAKFFKNIDLVIHRKRANFYFQHISRFIRPESRVLDLGAGSGLLSKMLQEKLNLKVMAFDIKQFDLSDYRVILFDGKNIPLEDKSIDTSICISVLHHASDPIKILQELNRVSKERVIIIEDRFDSWVDRFLTISIHYYLRIIESMDFNRCGFRTTSQWSRLLFEAGMRVEESIYLPPAVSIFPVSNTLIIARPGN